MERDNFSLYSCDNGRVVDKKEREMGDEDDNNMQDMSGYEKSGVRLD
jgi:hypothetical protein